MCVLHSPSCETAVVMIVC